LTEPVSKDIIVDIEQDIRAFCSVKYEEGIYLQYFAVTEKYRQQGIGKGLLGWILDHYKCNIYLHVRINNCVAINLYESMGFVRESEDQEWYYYAAAASSLNNF
jgi:ribosomal protein S18 acetylase RimI-like enzyme